MGNACGGFENPSLEKEMESIKQRNPNQNLTLNKLRELSQYYIVSRNISNEDSYYVEMLVSIRQLHLAEHIRKLQGKKKEEFMKKLKSIDFEELDIMSNQALINRHQNRTYRAYSQKNRKVIRYKLQNQEALYDYGSSVISNRAVALIVLVGCFGTKTGEEALSCLGELRIPSKKSCLQLLLERVCYLNEANNSNIPVFIVVEARHQESIIASLKSFQLNLKVIVKPYETTNPNVSSNGEIILQSQSNFSYSQGKGDFLREVSRLGITDILRSQNIEYLHIVKPTNILEKPCDPFSLGYLQQTHLDIVAKIVPAGKDLPDSGRLYLVETETEDICVKSNVPKEARKYIFTNSIFMRFSFLQSLSKQLAPLANLKMRSKECKTSVYDPINEQFVFPSGNNAMYFYRNPSDLIVGDNYKFMVVASEFQFCDIDIESSPEIALSNNFKEELGIQHTVPSDLLEISPLIYYDSTKGVEGIKKILGGVKEIGYPCYIKRREEEDND